MPATSWSAPGYNPDLNAASEAAKFQFQRQYGHAMPAQAKDQVAQAGQNIVQAMAGLKEAMDKRKTQAIAAELLSQGATPQQANAYAGFASTGLPADQIYQRFQQDKAKADTNEAQGDYIQGRTDWANMVKAENSAYGNGTAATPGGPNAPVVDQATGLVWNGHQWVKGGNNSNPISALSDEMKKTTGGSIGDWSSATDRKTVNGAYVATVTTPTGGTKTLSVPTGLGDLYAQRVQQLTGSAQPGQQPAQAQLPQNPGTDPSAPSLIPTQAASTPPQQAIDYLKANPNLTAQFDQKYGQGAAAAILGGSDDGE